MNQASREQRTMRTGGAKATRAAGTFVLAALLFATQAFASFEPLPVGARPAGMADAFTVVADDAQSVYYNPAGMMHVRRPEVSTYYSRLFLGLDDKSEINRSFLGYVQPLPKQWGRLGVSYVGLGLAGLYSESSLGLSYARSIGTKLNAGGTVKMLRKSFGTDAYTDSAINVDSGATLGGKDPVLAKGTSKSGISLDLGGQYRLAKNYAMGIALRNVNQPDMGIASSDKAPAVYALGVSRWTRVSSLSVELANWKFADSQDFRIGVGGERWYRSGMGMRAGLGVGSRQYRAVTLGGSYRMDGFQIDYGVNYPLAGVENTLGSHMVSITFRFGKPEPDPIEAQLKIEREARLRAEAETARLRQQLMDLTSDRPEPAPSTQVVDTAADDALRQAEEEIARLKKQEPVAELASAAPGIPAVTPKLPAVAPVAVPAKPAKPRIDPALLAQYGESLKFYSAQVKQGVPAAERATTLERIVDKYADKGVDVSSVREELKKLKGENSKTSEDYKLATNYYRRIVQQGTSDEERGLLLERIVKKYKSMGVDTGDLERELDNLKKKK
jgi:hypothetical protein